MPYYGGDGQSPGNEWVKTATGWRKLVALRENLHRHIKKIARERFHNSCKESSGEGCSHHRHLQQLPGAGTEDWAPGQSYDAVNKWLQIDNQNMHSEYQNIDKPQTSYVMIPRSAGAREMYFTIGETLCKLDLAGAVGDHRRFNYVCRLLELIVTTRFSSLSGLAQKNLLHVLEEVINLVTKTYHNMEQVRRIVRGAIVSMNNSFSTHIGCRATWNDRLNMLQGWKEKLDNVQVTEKEDDGGLQISDLPDEVINRVLHHLSDHRDIVNLGKTSHQFCFLANRNVLWRDLCQYHFTQGQINVVCRRVDHSETDWKIVYKKLYKRHPMHEVYTDMLQICAYCNCLFWRNGSHPCTKEQLPEGDTQLQERPELRKDINITPQQFLDLFPAPH